MPRKPARSKRRRTTELDREARQYLLAGWVVARWRGYVPPNAREQWERHRDELLSYWLQDPEKWPGPPEGAKFCNPRPGGPGTRPWGFWQFEAPGAPMDPPDDERKYLEKHVLLMEFEK